MAYRILFVTFFLFMGLYGSAKDDCMISVAVNVDSKVPVNLQSMLTSKLREAVAKNGMGGDVKKAHFVVVASTEELSKETVSGLRPVVAMTLELNLYIKNSYTGEMFAATSVSLSGSGRNQASAQRAAISNFSGQGRAVQLFMQEAKRKIEAFYNSQITSIISQAETMAAQNKFDEALFLLSSIPACTKKYDKAEKAMLDIFQQYIDLDCKQKLVKAQMAWNSAQNREGAKLAGAYLTAVDPRSDCTDEVQKLCKAISERIGEEWEFYKELKRDSVKHEELRIKAAMEIGKAFAENKTEPEEKQEDKEEMINEED